MIMFKHFEAPGDKATSAVMFNYGAGGLKVQNQNLEIGIKVKGESCVFFAHRGARSVPTQRERRGLREECRDCITRFWENDDEQQSDSEGQPGIPPINRHSRRG